MAIFASYNRRAPIVIYFHTGLFGEKGYVIVHATQVQDIQGT